MGYKISVDILLNLISKFSQKISLFFYFKKPIALMIIMHFSFSYFFLFLFSSFVVFSPEYIERVRDEI
jgi:hypothetical protein